MTIKKFIAANAHDAMQEVRRELGRDAMIISNRTTGDGIEILATDDMADLQPEVTETTTVRKQPPKTSSTSKRKDAAKPSRSGKRSTPPAMALETYAESTAPDNGQLEQLQTEIASLQGALQGLANTGSVTTSASVTEITLTGKLMALGLGTSMVQQLVEQCRPITQLDKAWQQALKQIKRQIKFTPGDFIEEGGVVVLHGPAGSGKTTALCKLAAEFLSSHSAGKLAIVRAANKHSLGGEDSLLNAVSQLLNVPIHHAEDPSALHQVISELKRKKLILVDTPGFNINQLNSFNPPVSKLRSKRNIKHCLVAAATAQGSLLDHMFGCLAETAIESVILTHTDQTRQIGTAIDSVLRSAMQLRYCSSSAEVHDPLHSKTTELLMHQLAGSPQQHRSLQTEMPAQISTGSVANWLESAIIV